MKRLMLLLVFALVTTNAFANEFAEKMKTWQVIQNADIGPAPWLGTTGLGADTEKELILYLRRELGAGHNGTGTILAKDLDYVGVFPEGTKKVHYWKVNWGHDEKLYATISIDANGDMTTSVGDSEPPK